MKHIHKTIHNGGVEGSPCGQNPASTMPSRRRLLSFLAVSMLLLAGCGGIAAPAGWAAPARTPDGSILVQVKPGEVRAIDPASGAERWHFPNSVKDEKASKRTSRPVKGTFYAAPVFDRDRIYLVSYEGHLVRIDRAQGAGEISTPWTVELGESVVATPVLNGGRLYIPTEGGEVVVVDAEDGSVASRYRVEAGRIWGAPLVSGENLIVSNFDHKTTYAMRLSDGKAAWSTGDAGASVADVVPAGQNILIGSLDGSLHALDAAGGGPRWQFRADGWVTGAPLVAGDTIYAGTMAGSVYALTLDGQQRWQFTLDGTKPEFRATPALVDGTLVVVARRGVVVGLDPATGKQRWRSEIADARLDASPLAVDGSVFLATTKHALIRVDASSGATQTISAGE